MHSSIPLWCSTKGRVCRRGGGGGVKLFMGYYTLKMQAALSRAQKKHIPFTTVAAVKELC